MNDTKEYTINFRSKQACKTVDTVEFIYSWIFLIILLGSVALKATILPNIPSYVLAVLILGYYVPLFIWEHWYDKKTHFSAHSHYEQRMEKRITSCPYCGSTDLVDTMNAETICKKCEKEIPIYKL